MKNFHKTESINWTVNLTVIAAILWTALLTLIYLSKFNGGITSDLTRWGQTGDFFGGVLNPMFGLLSLLALLTTLRQTEKSQQQSEEELRLSREEMKRSADALSEQSKDLKQQTFERTFFELLRFYNEIVDGFVTESNWLASRVFNQPERSPGLGRDALLSYCGQFKRRLLLHMEENQDEEQLEAINKVWLEYYKDKQNQLGHWFRSLYNILKFVDQSGIENKKFYTDLLRAQLSSPELLAIYYNANSDMGRDKLLPLIDKYNLLKHLDKCQIMFDIGER
ncbi:MAG TPA: hypothetical protein DE312_11180 [Gallionella sp.]|nr:MAG: hypothetical protein A2Z87_00755 [Gallionellales bacterium GWA2_54_124]HCI53855.1 hypothetical protein [Gallionella sp.]